MFGNTGLKKSRDANSNNYQQQQPKKRRVELTQEVNQDFSAPWHFSDVVLVVEERKFHVHRSTLSMWSPVFETMFTSEFKEKTAQEIPLPGKKASEIDALLRLIYFKSVQVNGINFEFFLKLADEYQMTDVKMLCISFMRAILHRETALHLYALASNYKFPKLMGECLEKVLSLKITFIENHEHFLELDKDERYQIVSMKAQAVEKAVLSSYESETCRKGLSEELCQRRYFSSCPKCKRSMEKK